MREKWQVFTPDDYVNVLLDSIGYDDNVNNKKILENACGAGNILEGIVTRYISCGNKNGLTKENIEMGLENDIYGVEIEPDFYEQCISRLNEITDKEGLRRIDWKIYCDDYLKLDLNIQFDYVVSNPPYIAYIDLSENEREFLRNNYTTCRIGKPDYCYAFIEKGFDCLSNSGKMAYLIPSSIFKNVFGNELRQLIKGAVDRIIDYTTVKVFDKVLVSSAVLTIDRNNNSRFIDYKDVANGNDMIIDKGDLSDKWIFGLVNNGQNRFGDYFSVSYPVATLLNDAFVIKNWNYCEDENFILVKEYKIEKCITRKAVSPKNLKRNREELIIFPYEYENGELKRYDEEHFLKMFPRTYEYLNENRMSLDKRKKDASGKWYEYGRSQALSLIAQRKLITSTVVTDCMRVYVSDIGEVPYAGMCIRATTDNMSLNDAKKILESKLFYEYVKKVGVYINGTSIRITAKDIENFCF